jgi:hypothetical protein
MQVLEILQHVACLALSRTGPQRGMWQVQYEVLQGLRSLCRSVRHKMALDLAIARRGQAMRHEAVIVPVMPSIETAFANPVVVHAQKRSSALTAYRKVS